MSDEAIGSFSLCSIRVTDAKKGHLLSEQRQGLLAIYKFNMAIEMFYGVTLTPQAHRDSEYSSCIADAENAQPNNDKNGIASGE